MSSEYIRIKGERYRQLSTVEIGDDVEGAIEEVRERLEGLRGKYLLYSTDPHMAGIEGAYDTEEEAMDRLYSISYDDTPWTSFGIVHDGDIVFGSEPQRMEFAVAAGENELAIVAK